MRALITLVVPSFAVLLAVAATDADSNRPVRVFVDAEASFDRFTDKPTAAQQARMRAHYWRMLTYSPYFDGRLAWFPNAWVYKDLYAIYVGSDLAAAHPDWMLRDVGAKALYIPFDCGGGTCPQYAADVGNADFRAHWIGQARTTLHAGYRGLFIDDVNLTLERVSDATGTPVVPTDPRTGQPMTEDDWRRYLTDFTAEVRSAFPGIEIVHNAIWYIGDADPWVAREITAADWICLERGVIDRGIQGGDGPFGFDTFLAHVDFIHELGRGVVYAAEARSRRDREYSLAAYFLTDGGNDGVGNGVPPPWWSGYGVGLGAPLGPRYTWSGGARARRTTGEAAPAHDGILRRDFARGVVLVNPPGAARQRVTLDARCRDLAGRPRTRITLPAAAGAVLRCP